MTEEAAPTPSLAPPLLLSAVEARVLGCLVEKEASTPDVYPLTLNAMVAACNQKTNREPLMNLEPGEVGHCLRVLKERGLVATSYGARVERFEHRMDAAYNVTRRRRVLLAVLLLRGPQTLNELTQRTERLADFQGEADVADTLRRLQEAAIPLVCNIGRAAGQREDRYMHLLCGPVSADLVHASRGDERSPSPHRSDLVARVEELERLVEQLRADLTRLQG